ncbi:MAG: hypothetical protein KJ065_01040 [Anaerolineae bacterium]|nr:hypothetical protein [Anaerolineae bacterium]
MTKREQLLSELQRSEDYGILLAAQVGGVPNELQLIVETAVYDAAAEGLRPRNNYIVRALGVREHRITLGVFGSLQFTRDHPLLYHHNTPRFAVNFQGKPTRLHEASLDISQAYASTFGVWRHITEISADINRAVPLVELLSSGEGLLGVMPKPLAERMVRVLEHHGMTATMQAAEPFNETDEHGRSRLSELLLIDQTYIIALAFSVEIMGQI